MLQLFPAPEAAATMRATGCAADPDLGPDEERISDPQQEIADIEAEIEELSDSAERCRKTIKVAGLAAGLGVVSILVILSGAFALPPLAFVAGISAVVGGIALRGSTGSTLDELRDSIAALEARRAAMIDRLSLRMIDADPDEDEPP